MSTMFVSGVCNGSAVQSPGEDGYCAAPHRAKVPTYRVVLNGTMLSGRYALDIERAMLLRRVTLAGLEVEERWYAHLVHRELLVHEITLNNTAGTAPRSVSVFSLSAPASQRTRVIFEWPCIDAACKGVMWMIP